MDSYIYFVYTLRNFFFNKTKKLIKHLKILKTFKTSFNKKKEKYIKNIFIKHFEQKNTCIKNYKINFKLILDFYLFILTFQ